MQCACEPSARLVDDRLLSFSLSDPLVGPSNFQTSLKQRHCLPIDCRAHASHVFICLSLAVGAPRVLYLCSGLLPWSVCRQKMVVACDVDPIRVETALGLVGWLTLVCHGLGADRPQWLGPYLWLKLSSCRHCNSSFFLEIG